MSKFLFNMGERIIRIAISAAFLVLFFYLSQGIFKACSNRGKASVNKTETAAEVLESDNATSEAYADEYFEDYAPEESEEYVSYGASETQEFEDDLFDEPEDKPAVQETPAPATKPAPRTQSRPSSSSSGKYIAVAGNYLIQDNAKNMVKKLQNIGYNDAELFIFDGSQYYTVSAVRSNDYDMVQSSARDLRQRGIDNYVHTVR